MKPQKLTDVQKDVLLFLNADGATGTSRFLTVQSSYAYLVIRDNRRATVRWDAFAGVPPRFAPGFSRVTVKYYVRLSTIEALAKRELIQVEKAGVRHGRLTQTGRALATDLQLQKESQ